MKRAVILSRTHIDVDIVDGEKTVGWMHFWLEAVKFPRAVEPLDGVETIARLQIVAAIQENVFASSDGLRRTF